MAEGLNQMIAMHGRGLNLDPAGALQRGVSTMAGMQDLQMQPLRKKEAELRLAALEQENEANTDEFKIRDLATDAIKIKPLLESGDLTRANTMIAERIQKIMQRGGDPSDTMAFRDALNSGQITPQQAAAELGMEIEAAQRYGVFSQGNVASSRTYEPVPMYENGKFTGMGIPTFDPRTGQARYTPIQGGQTVDPATLAGMKAGSSQTAQNVSDLNYKPKIAGGVAQAEADVGLATKPKIESAVTTAKETAKATVMKSADIIKKIGDEKEVGRILDMAMPLLDDATESLAGAAVDVAGGLVGVSTKGAQAAARLKALEGALIMKMPRMEGPQSNMDQMLYRQMAAQIGDATVPAEVRKAAVDTLRGLNQRYSGAQQQAGQPDEDAQALEWARANPNDPRAQQIMQMMGGK